MIPTLNLDRILVIIPVLNEAATIAGVIHSLQNLGLKQIRVVDNGSTDASAEAAKAAGAEVLFEPIRGYGRACWRGLEQLPAEIDWILFCDGDGSDDFSQLPEFFQLRDEFDLILGNRRDTAAGRAVLTPAQNFGNGLATLLMGLGWGHWYRDLGPLRLIRRSALEQLQMQDRGFGWTVEMQVRAIEARLRIWELPVSYRPRQGGKSKISGTLVGSVRAGTMILQTLGSLYGQRLGRSLARYPWLSGLLLLLGSILIMPYGDFRQLEVMPGFWVGAAVMGLGFALAWNGRSLSPIWFWSITLLSRLLLFPMYPGDDVWRYIWEGLIQPLGFSPYEFPPNAPELIAYRPEWWSQINHPSVTAIYPPVTQLGFRVLAAIAPTVALFKLGFVLADLMVCWLLSRKFGYARTRLYAWNPLVIYSFAGAAHYDSWLILPLVAAWLSFDKLPHPWRWPSAAVLVGLSAAVKWISLPILGFLVWRGFRERGWGLAVVLLLLGLLPLGLSLLPFCDSLVCPLIPTQSVFVAYGRSAEFFPHLLGQVWASTRQVNWIYLPPLLGVVLWLLRSTRSFLGFAEGYLIGVMFLSPIIHAWYFTWLIPFAVASRNLGTLLVSLSAFVYFLLPYRGFALGHWDWLLTPPERIILWLPFLLGCLWVFWQQRRGRLQASCSRRLEV